MLAHALDYAAAGFYVFPVDGKRPHAILGASGGYHHATTGDAQVRAWWGAAPDAGIGIALAASGLVCLDVDVAQGKPGAASYAALVAECPEIEACSVVAQTGSGGGHLLWRATDDMAKTRRIGYRPGLDLLSDGYIVAAPSPHASGGRYMWTRQGTLTDAPIALRAALASRERPARDPSKPDGTPASLGKIKPGSRNADMFRFAASLRNQGLGASAVLAACLAENAERFDPPLDDQEVHEVCGKAIRSAPIARDLLGGEAFREEIIQLGRDRGVTCAPERRAVRVGALALVEQVPIRSIATGLPSLDRLIGGGISTRQLATVIAPPGAGKTAWVIALSIVLQQTAPVLYVSTELESYEVLARIAGNVLNVPWREIVRGKVERSKVEAAVASLSINVIGCEKLPVAADALAIVADEAGAMRATQGTAPVVVVDYLQDLARGWRRAEPSRRDRRYRDRAAEARAGS
jgi:hypothetical protein